MAGHLEEILQRLLIPDSDTITQATNDLKEAFNDPNSISSLLIVASSSESPQMRQFATLLLRRRFKKKVAWDSYTKEVKDSVKFTIIQGLLANNTKLVRLALAQLAGTISSHREVWPELIQFLHECLKSSSDDMVELGTFTLSILCQTCEDQYQSELDVLLPIFFKILSKGAKKPIFHNVVMCLLPLAPLVGSQDMSLMQKIIPQLFRITRTLQIDDEDEICGVLELIDEFMDSEVGIMVPYVQEFIKMCLELVVSKSITESAKIKCLHSMECTVKLKPKLIKRSKLLVPIINILFEVMSLPVDDNGDTDDEVENAYTSALQKAAGQVLEAIAINFPPKDIVEPLIQIVQNAVLSDATFSKKAAFDALSMISDGCAEYLKAKYSTALLQLVGQGLNASDPIIVRSAMYTLGKFSQHLQPNVKEYAPQFIEVFIKYLATVSQGNEGMLDYKKDISRLFYAFTNFCENMDEQVIPHLPRIMEQLFLLVTSTKSVQIIDLVIQAFGSLAESAKQNMEPYFNQVMQCMKPYLTGQLSEEQLQLQIQAIATLSILARKMSREHFMPLAKDCFLIGLNNMIALNDPDLKRSIFRLFSSIVSILKEDSAEYFQVMFQPLLDSLQSTEGLEPNLEANEDDDDAMSFEIDKLSDWCFSGDEEDLCLVVTSYVEEKEDALDAIKEIADNAPKSIAPYLFQLLPPVFTFTNSRYDHIRKSALLAYGRLCCCLSKDPTEETLQIQKQCLSQFYPVLVMTIAECRSRAVVVSALETMGMLLTDITDLSIWQTKWLEEIMKLAFKVMHKQVVCQHSDDDSDEDDDEDEDDAEYDILLFEYAADLIPSMAKLIPLAAFEKRFQQYLEMMIVKLNKKRTNAERSFSAGMLARSCENMKKQIKPFIAKLYPAFMTALHDSDYEVRSNSVYGLGVLLEHTDELLLPEYVTILQELSSLIANEKDSLRVIDNACATLARMILTNPSQVPINVVLPSMIRTLPLKEDHDENEVIFKCFWFLLQTEGSIYYNLVNEHAEELLNVCAHVMQHDTAPEAARPIVQSVSDLLSNHLHKNKEHMNS